MNESSVADGAARVCAALRGRLTFSLWLVPDPADPCARYLQGLIDALAVRHGSHPFAPHVTLCPSFTGTQADAQARARRVVEALRRPGGGVWGAFTGVSHAALWSRAMVLEVEPTPEVAAATAEARAVVFEPGDTRSEVSPGCPLPSAHCIHFVTQGARGQEGVIGRGEGGRGKGKGCVGPRRLCTTDGPTQLSFCKFHSLPLYNVGLGGWGGGGGSLFRGAYVLGRTQTPPSPHQRSTTKSNQRGCQRRPEISLGLCGPGLRTPAPPIQTIHSGPQRVRMSSGARPIGAAKGKQSDTEALCQPPPPPRPVSPISLPIVADDGRGLYQAVA